MNVQAVDRLSERVRGSVTTPGDESYEEARKVYNAMIDRRPARSCGAPTTADVIAAVELRARAAASTSRCAEAAHSVPGFGTNDGGRRLRPLRRCGRSTSIPSAARRAPRAARPGAIFNDATHALRPGDDRRHHLDHGRRRAHARRRNRAPRARSSASPATT